LKDEKDNNIWRFGRIPYLEKVCMVNLNKLGFVNKIIRNVTKMLKLKKSITVYNKFGKGPEQILIFSKSGQINIENAYSTHHLNNRIIKLKSFININGT
jgi:hypothetical protein